MPHARNALYADWRMLVRLFLWGVFVLYFAHYSGRRVHNPDQQLHEFLERLVMFLQRWLPILFAGRYEIEILESQSALKFVLAIRSVIVLT